MTSRRDLGPLKDVASDQEPYSCSDGYGVRLLAQGRMSAVQITTHHFFPRVSDRRDATGAYYWHA